MWMANPFSPNQLGLNFSWRDHHIMRKLAGDEKGDDGRSRLNKGGINLTSTVIP